MSEWQPIKTAPDHTEVIVFSANDGVLTAMRVYGDWHASTGGFMRDVGNEYTELVDVYPTHWMPLPDPPK